ncbi:MAG: HlyD family secretion protein [Candidatus Schekmanbacteria bacterium]|nr:MAG: HlyD family secretion protein [Candidatus Schekmanbacteria bacterium]
MAEEKEEKRGDNRKSNNNELLKRRISGAIILLLVFTVCAVGGYYYWQYLETRVVTDNAYIRGHIHMISPRITGTVLEVYVKDNMKVKKGDLLLKIDPADYIVQVKKAESALENAQQEVRRRYAAVETAKAALNLSKARLELAKIELNRIKTLVEKKVKPKDEYDRAFTAYQVAVAQVKADEEKLRQAKALITPGKPEALIEERRAELEKAELNLKYTEIYAPVDGYITRKSVEKGNHIIQGQALLAIVPLDDIWVEANFKETQLEKLKKGMKAIIEVDTYPDEKFEGHIESIMAGTGSAFSILPPENATGNWVKVVQRIPVKILFDGYDYENGKLRIGMSCIVTIPLSVE